MSNKIDILAIGVHPDDIELGCGGTIVKHIDLGFTVGAVKPKSICLTIVPPQPNSISSG